MAQIVDSYSENNYDSWATLGAVPPDFVSVGQSFTGDGGTLNSAKFYLNKDGSPTGDIVAKVYAHTGTFGTSSRPTGSALAISNNVDVSTLTTSSQLITFNFTGANKITLENGTYYCVLVEYSNGDGGNHVHYGLDTESPTHGGNSFYWVSGNWSYSNYDLLFYVYKDDSSPDVTITPSVQTITSSTPAPTVTAVKNVIISPNALTVTASINSPSLSLDAVISPSVISVISSIDDFSIIAIKNIIVTPSVQALQAENVNAGISSSGKITYNDDRYTYSTGIPYIGYYPKTYNEAGYPYNSVEMTYGGETTAQSATVGIDTKQIALTIPQITVVGDAIVAVDVQSVTSTAPSADISIAIVVEAGVQAVTSSAEAQTIEAIKNVTIAPDAQALSAITQDITISAIKNVSISAEAQILTATATEAVISTVTNVAVSPDAQSITTSNLAISIVGDALIQANLQNISSSAVAPTILVPTPVTITPDPLNLISTAPILTLIVEANITVTPDSLVLTSSLNNIAVTGNAVISPDYQELTSSLLNPTVAIDKDISVQPQYLTSAINEIVVTAEQNFNISIKPRMKKVSVVPSGFVEKDNYRNSIIQPYPYAFAEKTNAFIENNGLTYNQIGYNYNSEVTYGGLTNSGQVIELPSKVSDIKPRMVAYRTY